MLHLSNRTKRMNKIEIEMEQERLVLVWGHLLCKSIASSGIINAHACCERLTSVQV